MKKLNKLFAMLIAVLGVGTLSAQTWDAPVVGVSLNDVNDDTELYLYNVKADAFACSGMSWSSHAIVKELQNGDSQLSNDVHRCRVTKPADGQVQIKLNEKEWLGGGGPASTNDCWVDHGSNNVYIYNVVNTNTYTLKPTTATNDSYLDCSWAYGGHITFSATNGYGNTEWAFVLRSDITSGKYLLYKAKKEMYDIYTAVVAAGRESTYATALATANAAYVAADATAASVNAATRTLLKEVAPVLSSGYFMANSLFNNPDMRGYGDDTDWGDGLNAFANGIFESWHSAETITQTQTGLPNGFYTVVFLGMYRQDGSDAAPTLTLTSGENSSVSTLKATSEIDFGTIEGAGKHANNSEDWVSNKPNNTYGAGQALAHTDAGVKVENFVVENGELTIAVAMPSTSQWLLCQGFQIYYKAESVEDYANLFNEAKTAAEAIDQTTINTYAKGVLTTALSNAANEQVDKAWYQERTVELNDAVVLANSLVAPYASLNALVALCTGYAAESYSNVATTDVRTTFTEAITIATSSGDAATTVAALNEVYNTLETARQEYVKVAIPTTGNSFDMTFLMTNAQVTSATGWTNGGTASGEQYTGAPDNTYLDWCNWSGSIATKEMYNSVTTLPAGTYSLKAATRADGRMSGYLYAQTATETYKADIHKVGNSGNTLGGGWGWTEISGITVTDANLTVGVHWEAPENGVWAGADNFTLLRAYDESLLTPIQESVASLKTEAEGLQSSVMNADVKEALTQAIDGADASTINPFELESMVSALSSAITNANASIADYEKILTYITKAKKGIDESIAAEYQTAYDNRTITESAETVFQKLEVATYNYVTNNFTYNVELPAGNWVTEGPTGSLSSQHYSGKASPYLEQSSEAWGWSSWSIVYKQDKTLPAGDYVFKVAGRRAAGTGNTMSLVVTNINDSNNPIELGSVNDFPEGDTGLGINKNGVTSFDANDEVGFAKDGKGYGWQWRYVKFTLDSETTVQVAVNAQATTNHQWVSFCGATLQMTEETYLEANKGGLDAPTAAAQALINSKPMGDAENTALQEALDMTYNTGGGLLAKITALETAVDNANAWVTAYNEAKAPLVAALERFEADYNDAENGALNHMNKIRWTTAVSMAQAAAEAKDITNSYEGFATATENLVAALDAATVSVNEYAALKEAIDNAEALLVAPNWGDKPFQRPESAKAGLNTDAANAIYAAAEADGEDVTSVTEALNAPIVLNAPSEEQFFSINVAVVGHPFEGCPVVATLGNTGDNNPTGYGFAAKNGATTYELKSKIFTFTQVEGNLYNISVKVDENIVYLTYGVTNGSTAGHKNWQIQGNTDVAKAGEFEIEASTTIEGAIKIRNTVTGTYLDCQDGGSVYTDDGITNDEFALVDEATASVTIDIAEKVKFATCVLKFNATLPDGLQAYVPAELEGNCLILEEVDALNAYTPYILYAEEGCDVVLEGINDVENYQAVVNGDYLSGAIESQTITEGYVLQNQEEGVKFYMVDSEKEVPAGKCWLNVVMNETPEATARSIRFSFSKGDADGIDKVENVEPALDGTIYTLDGKRVNRMERGQIYVINGQKVMVK